MTACNFQIKHLKTQKVNPVKVNDNFADVGYSYSMKGFYPNYHANGP